MVTEPQPPSDTERRLSRQSTYPLTPEITSAGQIEMPDLETVETNRDNAKDSDGQIDYPTGLTLISIFTGLFLAVLCTGLDRSIIATAIPKITSDFNSLSDVGWYGSSYLLTGCAFQLMIGKLYAEFSIKWMFVIMLVIFEVGSVLCAAAPNSPTLIVGRAIAGLGASGISTGALIIIAAVLPLHKRPKYTGAIGAAMGIAQVVAPTLGGVFTDKATWRWCFWINLPLGGVTLATVLLQLRLPARPTGPNKTWRQILEKFDFLGTAVIVPCIICLLLALEWGGTQYPWSNWRCILLLCLFSILGVLWAFIQVKQGDKATLPLRIISKRSMICAMWFMFTMFGVVFIIVYYVSIWFQSVKNVSAYHAGVNYLTTTVSMSVMAIASGFLTSRVGYYVPQLITSSILVSVATGLITQFDLHTSTGYWIGTLILFGIGVGVGGQQSIMVPQTIFSGPDISLGTSAMMFMQTLTGSVFLSVAQNIWQSKLLDELHSRVPEADPKVVIANGASGLVAAMSKIYSEETVAGILAAYSKALQNVWIIAVVLACLSIFGAAFMEWKSVKAKKQPASESSDNDTTDQGERKESV